MGCDIHIGFERRKDAGSRWEAFVPSRKCVRHLRDASDCLHCSDRNGVSLGYTGGRNYALFALLADVRNYYNIMPLAAPRGYPDDMSERLLRAVSDIDGEYERNKQEFDCNVPTGPLDGHSASWFTLLELLAVDRSTPIPDRNDGTYGDTMAAFWELVDELKSYGEPEHVRIVFDFDN